ncbi:hypothetical protein GCM10027059_39470 [Myceligenerans halotolerans]
MIAVMMMNRSDWVMNQPTLNLLGVRTTAGQGGGIGENVSDLRGSGAPPVERADSTTVGEVWHFGRDNNFEYAPDGSGSGDGTPAQRRPAPGSLRPW